MKSSIKIIVAAVLLIVIAMSLAACGNEDVYESLAEDGYTIKVRFDAGGAFVNETQNVEIVEVYSVDSIVTVASGKQGVKLLSPEDSRRGEAVFKLAKTDGKYNYFQIGWYRERTPVLDEAGNALDVFGNLCSVSGLDAAYTYSGRWDFENDVVSLDELTDGAITLYAAWAPFFTYEFYSENESGVFEKIDSKQKLTLLIPTVSESTGKVNMKDFPKKSDKVFASAYLDEALTEMISENIDGRALFVDYESGTVTENVIKIYVVWSEE